MNRCGYFIPPAERVPGFPPYCHFSREDRLLSPPECDALISLACAKGFAPGSVGSKDGQRIDELYRKVDAVTLAFGSDTDWLYERLTDRITAVNRQLWGFDLVGLLEPFQVLRYQAAQISEQMAGHYDLHQDFGAGYTARRKLSFVAQLSDPADYAGCRLTLHHHRQEELPYVGRGDAVVFPSWTPHSVSDITMGTRFAVVNWIHGPPFR